MKIYYGEVSFLLEDGVFNRRLSLVNGKRQEKVLRMRQPMDRCRSLGAGLLLRQGLLREGLDYEGLAFGEGEAGKPFLLQKPDLHFNLSHAGVYAAAAFGQDRLGVDVERLAGRFAGGGGDKSEAGGRVTGGSRDEAGSKAAGDFRDADGGKAAGGSAEWGKALERAGRIGRRILTEQEKCYLKGLKGAEYLSEFTRIWTRKEAYAKALGVGLKLEFSQADTLGEDFALSRRIGGDYWISVCKVDGSGRPRRIEGASWEELVL